MNGLVMQQPLLISSLLVHAERHHGDQEIVSRRVEGDIHGRPSANSRALATNGESPRRPRVVAGNGSRPWPGKAIATSSCTTRCRVRRGAAHAQPRLHPDQVVYIADHAEDQVLFFDLTFLPLIEAIAGSTKTIRHLSR